MKYGSLRSNLLPRLFAYNPVMMGGKKSYTDKLKALAPTVYYPMNEPSGTTAVDQMGFGNGVYNGVVLGHTGIGDGKTCPYFDNDNDYMKFHSTAFASAWNGNLFTLSGWLKVFNAGVWTDGAFHDWVLIYTNSSNLVFVRKNSVNGQIQFNRTGGGTAKSWSVDIATYIPVNTDWFHLAVVCDVANNSLKGYINGINVTPGGNVTGNISWSGALDSNYQLLGGSIAIPAIEIHEWYGWQAHFAVWCGSGLQSSIIENLAKI